MSDETKVVEQDLLLGISNLKVSFANGTVQAVRGIDLTVAPGETVAVVGESGSGKSVTALSLMRLVEFGGGSIDSGEILFRQRNHEICDIATLGDAAARELRGNDIAMIFQEPMTSLNPVFRIGDQIIEAIVTHQNNSVADARKVALEMLETVRIPDAANIMARYPHQLSGGMRQRVMIALALSCRPQLLIADEPTTALDVTIQAQILRLIRDLQDTTGMAVLFITHDMGVVAEVADRVVVMYHGEKVEEGTVEDVFSAPQHPYTKALLTAVPRLGAMNGTDHPAPFSKISTTELEAVKSKAIEVPVVDYDAEPVLSVRGLTTRFDLPQGLLGRVRKRVHAVEKLDLDIWPGETLGIVGESGCGKSTTGRSLLRLVSSHFDEMRFDGQVIDDFDKDSLMRLRREIQFIFQDPYASLNPRLTVGFSICEPMLLHKLETRKNAFDRAVWLLEQVGLSADHARRYPHAFSGGQRQRVAIARALSTNPKLIIADEAVSALDVSIQAQVINLMMELQHKFGLSYLFISHDMAVVERISHRVGVMFLGQIVERGTRRQVFENPQHSYTQRLMSAAPVPDPRQRNKDRAQITGEIPSPIRSIDNPPRILTYRDLGQGHQVALE